MYHFLSMMVGPRFLSAGLMIMSSLVLRFHITALMVTLSSGVSLRIVSLRVRVILKILSLHLARYALFRMSGELGVHACVCRRFRIKVYIYYEAYV
jgi:hypothetical protein